MKYSHSPFTSTPPEWISARPSSSGSTVPSRYTLYTVVLWLEYAATYTPVNSSDTTGVTYLLKEPSESFRYTSDSPVAGSKS